MTEGIDFVIGGKDRAKPAMSSVEKSLMRLERRSDTLRDSTLKLSRVTGVLASAYLSVKSAVLAFRGIEKLNDAYDAQVGAVEGLEVALGLQGEAVEEESARLQEYASQLQEVAAVGDEVSLKLMRQASLLGISSDKLDDAAAAAVGLSEATGRGLDQSLQLVNQAMAGNFEAFNRVLPQIRNMTTDEEKLAAVLNLAQTGLEAKAEASQTVAGMSERASNSIGDLMESVGEILAPIRVLISAGLEQLAKSLQDVVGPAVEWARGKLENIGPTVEWVRGKVVSSINTMIEAFTFMEVVVGNLDTVWDIAASQAELSLRTLAGNAAHFLTEVIPAHAIWFSDNFVNIIRDTMRAAEMIVMQAAQNLSDAFDALWEFVATKGESDVMGRLGEIAGRSYLEGFQSSVTALPDVAERVITAREAELAAKIGAMADGLGQEFSDKLKDRLLTVGSGIGDDLSKTIELDLSDRPDLGKAGGSGGTGQVTEARLLTRGSVDRRLELLEMIRKELSKAGAVRDKMAFATERTREAAEKTATNTEQKVLLFQPE